MIAHTYYYASMRSTSAINPVTTEITDVCYHSHLALTPSGVTMNQHAVVKEEMEHKGRQR